MPIYIFDIIISRAAVVSCIIYKRYVRENVRVNSVEIVRFYFYFIAVAKFVTRVHFIHHTSNVPVTTCSCGLVARYISRESETVSSRL